MQITLVPIEHRYISKHGNMSGSIERINYEQVMMRDDTGTSDTNGWPIAIVHCDFFYQKDGHNIIHKNLQSGKTVIVEMELKQVSG